MSWITLFLEGGHFYKRKGWNVFLFYTTNTQSELPQISYISLLRIDKVLPYRKEFLSFNFENTCARYANVLNHISQEKKMMQNVS